MELFLVILAIGLVSTDKLDRTYLPPAGANFAGGSLQDLQTPLEYPLLPDIPLNDKQFNSGSPQYIGNKYLNKNQNLKPNEGIEIGNVPNLQSYDNRLVIPNGVTYKGSPNIKTTQPSYTFNVKQTAQTTPSSIQLEQTTSINFKEPVEYNLRPFENKYTPYDGYETQKGQYVPPTPSTADISVNYEPNAFGFYGGNPMIIVSKEPIQNNIQSVVPNNKAVPNYASQNTGLNIPQYLNNQGSTNIPQLGLQINSDQSQTQLSDIPNKDFSIQNTKINLPQYLNEQNLNNNQQKPYKYIPENEAFTNIGNQNIETYLPQYSSIEEPKILRSGFESSQDQPKTLPALNTVNKYMPKINADGSKPTSDIRNLYQNYKPRKERPQAESDRNAEILNYSNVITPDGYAYSFDTSNGIHADESGSALDGVKAVGSYSYIGDDGKLYKVEYTADENGFQPRGDHLPTPPPIPEAIQKVIDQALKNKAAGIIDDGSYDESKYGHMNYHGAKGIINKPFTVNNRQDSKNSVRIPGKKTNGLRYKDNKSRPNYIDAEKNQEVPSDDRFYSKDEIKERINKNNDNNRNTDRGPINQERKFSTKTNKNSSTTSKNNINYQTKPTESGILTSSQSPSVLRSFYKVSEPPINFMPTSIPEQTYTKRLQDQNSRFVNSESLNLNIMFDKNTGYNYEQPKNGFFENRLPQQQNFFTPDTQRNQINITPNTQSTETYPNVEQTVFNQNPSQIYSTKPTYTLDSSMIRSGFNSDSPKVSNTFEGTGNQLQTTQHPETASKIFYSTRKPYDSSVAKDTPIGDQSDRSTVITEKDQTPTYNQGTNSYFYSTTPMPSETKYHTDDYDRNTNLPTATTIQNSPKSFGTIQPQNYQTTYVPTLTNAVKLSPTTKVDGFGRPLPTEEGYNNFGFNNQLSTTTLPTNYDEVFTGYPDLRSNIQDRFGNTPSGEKIAHVDRFGNDLANFQSTMTPIDTFNQNGKFSNNIYVPEGVVSSSSFKILGGLKEGKTTPDFANEFITERILGEDFSGPKQPQRFDPDTGYYY